MKVSTFFGPNRFLSNFYPAPFTWDNIHWPTSEHAYQAAKFTDPRTRVFVSQLPSPQAAKAYGKGKGPTNWKEISVGIMYEICKAKFTQNTDLRKRLIATGDGELEEGNTWHDNFWGICPPNSGQGRNELGKILMKLREEFNNEQ